VSYEHKINAQFAHRITLDHRSPLIRNQRNKRLLAPCIQVCFCFRLITHLAADYISQFTVDLKRVVNSKR